MDDQAARGERFRALHEGEPFVIPNPWDAGSARVLEGLGFARARDDELGVRVHARAQRRRGDARRARRARDGARAPPRACRSPSTSRTASGPSPSTPRSRSSGPPGRARSAARSRTGTPAGACTSAGTRSSASPRRSRPPAASGFPFTLTARAENHIRGNPDLDDTIARLQAYEAAGADVLYAPGLRSADEIRAVCSAVARPVNVLALRAADVRGDRRGRRAAGLRRRLARVGGRDRVRGGRGGDPRPRRLLRPRLGRGGRAAARRARSSRPRAR